MKILFHLGHPAHFHLFKNVISKLEKNGHKTDIVIKEKDVLKKLLNNSGFPFTNILPGGKTNGRIGLLKDFVIRGKNLFSYCNKTKPDLLVGTSADISYIGKLLNIPAINVNEDDAHVVPLYAWTSYPWVSSILSPVSCDNGRWDKKTVKYAGYHELAYLHPDHFEADKKIISKYIQDDSSFIIMRFANLNAHHDKNIKGITNKIALKLVDKLSPYGQVLITSERKLPVELESHRLEIDPIDIHHFLAYAKLLISDSQTMSAEAAVLGTPYIRYNDFVGKIGYLEELENIYKLGFGFRTGKIEKLIAKAVELASANDASEVFKIRQKKMLQEKINTADFLYNFISSFLVKK